MLKHNMGGGRVDRNSEYCIVGSNGVQLKAKVDTTPTILTTPTIPTTTATKPVAPSNTGNGTKADQLRAFMKQAKADTGSEAFEATINWAIATLGMTRSLARSYVRNNSNKV